MPKVNPFLPPQSVTQISGEPSETVTPLVNENDKEQLDGDLGQIVDNLRAEIKELEEKNIRVIDKKDKAERANVQLRVDLEDANRRAATHGLKAQRMRVFCELLNGMAARGDFKPFHPTANPSGVRDNAAIDGLITHAAGVAERAVKIVDERFAK